MDGFAVIPQAKTPDTNNITVYPSTSRYGPACDLTEKSHDNDRSARYTSTSRYGRGGCANGGKTTRQRPNCRPYLDIEVWMDMKQRVKPHNSNRIGWHASTSRYNRNPRVPRQNHTTATGTPVIPRHRGTLGDTVIPSTKTHDSDRIIEHTSTSRYAWCGCNHKGEITRQ